jgi:hypothetical protein
MYFDELSVTTTLRIICNAYLYSCLLLMGASYLGYLMLNRLEKSPQQTHFHWFG